MNFSAVLSSNTATECGLHLSQAQTELQNLGYCFKPATMSMDSNYIDTVNNFIYFISAAYSYLTVTVSVTRNFVSRWHKAIQA